MTAKLWKKYRKVVPFSVSAGILIFRTRSARMANHPAHWTQLYRNRYVVRIADIVKQPGWEITECENENPAADECTSTYEIVHISIDPEMDTTSVECVVLSYYAIIRLAGTRSF
jgi:hypothetical protein